MSEQTMVTQKETGSKDTDFVSVKSKSRKRKLVTESDTGDTKTTEMDTTDQPTEVKRPHFPPISSDLLKVIIFNLLLHGQHKCSLPE